MNPPEVKDRVQATSATAPTVSIVMPAFNAEMWIARAIEKLDPSQRIALKRSGLLTRDARKKERKKYGQRGARARFQFSKR